MNTIAQQAMAAINQGDVEGQSADGRVTARIGGGGSFELTAIEGLDLDPADTAAIIEAVNAAVLTLQERMFEGLEGLGLPEGFGEGA